MPSKGSTVDGIHADNYTHDGIVSGGSPLLSQIRWGGRGGVEGVFIQRVQHLQLMLEMFPDIDGELSKMSAN